MVMGCLVPVVISLILRLGALAALVKARFMSLCHSFEERMELLWPGNSCTMMCMGGMGHALSVCLDCRGIGVSFHI